MHCSMRNLVWKNTSCVRSHTPNLTGTDRWWGGEYIWAPIIQILVKFAIFALNGDSICNQPEISHERVHQRVAFQMLSWSEGVGGSSTQIKLIIFCTRNSIPYHNFTVVPLVRQISSRSLKVVDWNNHHTITVLRPFFRDHPGETVPEENFWTLWCKGRLTEANTPPPGRHSIRTKQWYHLHHPPFFYRPDALSATNSVKALKATSTTIAKPA